MIKTFADSEEKYLMGVKVYFNSTDSILYYDYDSSSETPYTNAVSKDDLINLFEKGLLMVIDSTDLVRPGTLTVSTDYAAVSVVVVGELATSVKSYYSDGYTAD